MRSIDADLLSFLQSGTEFVVAELWELTPPGKPAQYYTSAGAALTYGDNVYQPLDLERGDIEDAVGLQVATLEVTIFPEETAEVDGQIWPAAALNGYFDAAEIKLRLLFLVDWVTQVGAVLLFTGTVADIEVLLGSIKLTAKSIIEVFNQPFPRNLYQSTCPFLLYDDNCGLTAADWAETGAAAAGSTAVLILDASLTQADDYFALGYVEFISGDLAGFRRTVESSVSGELTLAMPFPQAPAIGDGFLVYPGCDRTQDTCENKFSKDNFGGQPDIPVPEVLY